MLRGLLRSNILARFSTCPRVEDFYTIEMRVGRIIECEPNPNSDQLYIESIDIKDQVLEIGSKLAKHIPHHDMQGLVLVIRNLKPRKLAGIMSHGMIVAASLGQQIQLLRPHPDCKIGERVQVQGYPVARLREQILNPKKNLLEICMEHCKVNSGGQATFGGKKLLAQNKVITSSLKGGKIN